MCIQYHYIHSVLLHSVGLYRLRRKCTVDDNTYTAKILIQQLHISVDDFQSDQFVVLVLYGTAEIQAGISKTGHIEQRVFLSSPVLLRRTIPAAEQLSL